MEPGTTPDPTIGSLIKGILEDVQTLFREELALARVEVTRQVVQARTAALQFGAAAGAVSCAVAFVMIALALGLADMLGWRPWAGFFTVGLALGLLSLLAFRSARHRLYGMSLVPEETVTTLKENSAWIAKRLSSEPR